MHQIRTLLAGGVRQQNTHDVSWRTYASMQHGVYVSWRTYAFGCPYFAQARDFRRRSDQPPFRASADCLYAL